MFKTDGTTIKVTRGDHGIIDFFIPLKDKKGYWKYQDNENNVYWYDVKNNKLYDSSYEISSIDIKTLTLQLHTFNVDDVIRFKVFKKKDCNCVEIQKDIYELAVKSVFINNLDNRVELLNKDMGDSIPLMTLDQAKEYFYAAMKLGDGARHKRLFVIKNRLNERDRDLFQRWLGEEFGAHYLNHWKSHKVINLHKYNIQ